MKEREGKKDEVEEMRKENGTKTKKKKGQE